MVNFLQSLFLLMVSSLIMAQSPYRPKLSNGDYCQVPFEYNGKYHHDCIIDGGSSPWCRPSKNSWGYCAAKPDFGTCGVAPPTSTDTEVQSIVDLVNNIRAGEPALRMTKLRWNSELAQRAQYMSNQCKLGSDDTNLCTSKSPMGQMSYVTKSTQPQSKKWTQFILEFFAKKSSYDLDSNICKAQYCNGYKQLVNAQTTDIGCAVTTCNEGEWYADYYFCNFYPPIYQGKPYEKGEGNCNSCYKLGDYSFKCNNKLCEICDKPGADCVGKDELQKEIESGKLCDDLDPKFCEINSSVCPHINYLPDNQKTMMLTKCKKSCKLCT